MKKEKYSGFAFLLLIAIILQSYLQQTETFAKILGASISFFIPLIWAAFLSILLYPLQKFLQEHFHLKRTLALIVVLLLLVFFFSLFMLIVIPQVSKSIKELQQIYPYIEERVGEFLDRSFLFLHRQGLLLMDEEEIMKVISEYSRENVQKIQQIGISIFWNVFDVTFGIANFLIGLFLACFILLKPEDFINVIERLVYLSVKKEKALYMIEILRKSKDIFLNYFMGRLLVSVIVAFIVFLVLFFSKTPYPVLTALLFGIGNMIPYLGVLGASLISGFLILIFAPYKIGYLIFAILLSQALDGFIIGPKIVGDKVGLNSFWVVVAILLCGKLMGIAGMFLGVPIFCIIKLIYQEKWKAYIKNEEREKGTIEDEEEI